MEAVLDSRNDIVNRLSISQGQDSGFDVDKGILEFFFLWEAFVTGQGLE